MNSISSELRGTVQLNHKALPVDVVHNAESGLIRIGDDTFRMSSDDLQYMKQCEDYHMDVEQFTGTIDRGCLVLNRSEDVFVETAAGDVAHAAKAGIAFLDYRNLNRDECHFTPGDNALVVRADNIKGTFVANFAHLDPVPLPGGPS